MSHHVGERQTQKLHLVDEDDQLLVSSDNSRKIIAIEENETILSTFAQETIESSQLLKSNKRPKISSLKTRISEEERMSKLHGIAARDRNSNSEKASCSGHDEEPIDKPSSTHIQRENIPSNHHKKETMKPMAEQYKLHPELSSTSCKGNLASFFDQKCLTMLLFLLRLHYFLIIYY